MGARRGRRAGGRRGVETSGGGGRNAVGATRTGLDMGLARLLPRPNVRPASVPAPAETQVIVLANQKGGVAKTTTTLNLGVAFAEQGFKVLLIDLDPQGNLTMSQGLNPDTIQQSMFDVLVHRLPIEQVIETARGRHRRLVDRPRRRRHGAREPDRPRARAREGARADARIATTTSSSTRRRRSGC